MHRKYCLAVICLVTLFFFVNISNHQTLVKDNKSERIPFRGIETIPAWSAERVEFTWTARDSPSPSDFLSDEVAGDHITIQATCIDFPVIESELFFDSWISYDVNLIQNENDGFNPFSDNIPIGDSHFSWQIVGGMELGSLVHLVFNFDTSNCDLMAWAGNSNVSTWYYSNNLLQTNMVSNSNPEISSLIWPVDSQVSVYIAVYNHDPTSGSGNLELYPDFLSNANTLGDTVTYDTYRKSANIVKSVLYVGSLGGSSKSYGYLPTTSFVNYFPPEVELLTPVAGDNWIDGQYNITWSASDRNSDDGIWFELFLLHSEPEYYFELGTGEFNYDSSKGFYYYTIDATGIQPDNYNIRIVAHDNDTTVAQNWPDLQASDVSGLFLFGNDFIPNTEFSNTSTATTDHLQNPMNLLLVVNLGLGITILVFVILIIRGKKVNIE